MYHIYNSEGQAGGAVQWQGTALEFEEIYDFCRLSDMPQIDMPQIDMPLIDMPKENGMELRIRNGPVEHSDWIAYVAGRVEVYDDETFRREFKFADFSN